MNIKRTIVTCLNCIVISIFMLSCSVATVTPSTALVLNKGDHVVFVGSALGEREQYFGHIETLIHQQHPHHQLVLRNMCRGGDEINLRIRADQSLYGEPSKHLTEAKADVVVGFFGFSESFRGREGLKEFEERLAEWIIKTRQQKYNGTSAPRLVLVAPIAFENLKDPLLPNGIKENKNIAAYANSMKQIAYRHNVTFVDTYAISQQLMTTNKITFNGIHLTEKGYQLLAPAFTQALFGKTSTPSHNYEKLRAEVLNKNNNYFLDHRAVNGVHWYGRRYRPYGPQNFPAEFEKRRKMTEVRDQRIWSVAQGKKVSKKIDDSKTGPLPVVETNRPVTAPYLSPEESMKQIVLEDGYKIELFASEEEWPELANPVEATFDAQGRLWVCVLPSYPQNNPGDEFEDKILIFEDANKDGKADKMTVFADKLHMPIGFEFYNGGVIVSQEPNVMFLKDTDGDDVADVRQRILHGFDPHDSHHAIGAFIYSPGGGLLFHEGTFLNSAIETPYGTQRLHDAGLYRFEPKTYKTDVLVSYTFANPWGSCFDEWGQHFIADASGGANVFATAVSHKLPFHIKHKAMLHITKNRIRPTSGCEIISSRHFPDEVQGNFMIANCIGFLGLRRHHLKPQGSGYWAETSTDLLSSRDPNFRPTDFEFAPDGSLYVTDWHNTLIGHMQHNIRDPKRDHSHGRIYRITYPARKLVTPAKIQGASFTQLFDNLKLPEIRTRYRTRRYLGQKQSKEVIPALNKWISQLNKNDKNYEHHLVEAAWVYQYHHHVNEKLLRQLLSSKNDKVRTAAVRLLKHWGTDLKDTMALLKKAADDISPKVRLEAVVTATWHLNEDSFDVVYTALNNHKTDYYLDRGIEFSLYALEDFAKNSTNSRIQAKLQKVSDIIKTVKKTVIVDKTPKWLKNKKQYKHGKDIYLREGHCATCHQKNGKGLTNLYPPLKDSEWVLGNDKRLVKLILHGLHGPITVNNKLYDSPGMPPMTAFKMLSDKEITAVISYIRNSFGNKLDRIVKAKRVGLIREETKNRVLFYKVDELLKEHPMKKDKIERKEKR